MKDKYILECTCTNDGNDFGMKLNQVTYYNINAQTFQYLTKKWGQGHFVGNVWAIDEYTDNRNPYTHDYFNYCIPVTPNINNATIYKNLASIEKVKEDIEKVGDFTCRILRLKTTVEPME